MRLFRDGLCSSSALESFVPVYPQSDLLSDWFSLDSCRPRTRAKHHGDSFPVVTMVRGHRMRAQNPWHETGNNYLWHASSVTVHSPKSQFEVKADRKFWVDEPCRMEKKNLCWEGCCYHMQFMSFDCGVSCSYTRPARLTELFGLKCRREVEKCFQIVW